MTDSISDTTAKTGGCPDVTENLGADDAPRVDFPSYDRTRLTPSVVHLGVGGFHRAHQAVYFDKLARRGHTGWGVVGVGIARPEMGEVLDGQDNLYLVVERGAETGTARLIGSMVDYLLLADQPDAVESLLRDPRTRLVTLTVTGDGYAVDESDDAVDDPTSIFVPVVGALDARRRAGVPPFTILSCDNLPDASEKARHATLTVARRRSPELVEWIEQNACFPASMVDRITPHTSTDDRDAITDEFALHDRWPVVTEPFSQWVIEDCFSDGRPPLDDVGARFVTDVGPYKLIKSRLLNGSHSAIGYVGYLAGHRTSAEAMADPMIAGFVQRMMAEEIAPGLPADVPGMELDSYQQTLLERFSSPAIADSLDRLCRRGSTKLADYLLPSLQDAAAAGRRHPLLSLVIAAWCLYLRGEDLDGDPIEVQDPRLEELQPLAREGVAALLGVHDLFGDLGRDQDFIAEAEQYHDALKADGVDAVLRGMLA